MFSKKGRCPVTVLFAVAAALLLSAEQAQAQCRGGSSQMQTRSPQNAMMNVLQRQQQQAALLTAVQPQAAMLIGLQQQNAMLTAALQQQRQQNALEKRNGQRTPKPRQQPLVSASRLSVLQMPDPESPSFIILQPKQPK